MVTYAVKVSFACGIADHFSCTFPRCECDCHAV